MYKNNKTHRWVRCHTRPVPWSVTSVTKQVSWATVLPTCIVSVGLLTNHMKIFHLRKLLVAHLIGKLPASYGTQKSVFDCTKPRPWTTLWASFKSCCCKIHFNIILRPKPNSQNPPLPLRFSNLKLYIYIYIYSTHVPFYLSYVIIRSKQYTHVPFFLSSIIIRNKQYNLRNTSLHFLLLLLRLSQKSNTVKKKSKMFPLQARCGPEGG